MWLLFHRRAGTKAVDGGRQFTEECPTCQRHTRFVEVECSEKYGVWFVDVTGDSERAFACTVCGDTFDLKDDAEAPPKKTAPAPPIETAEQKRQAQRAKVEALAAEQRRRDAEAAKKRAQIETRIDDELAELKKRMGK
jgi:hypothetical protein